MSDKVVVSKKHEARLQDAHDTVVGILNGSHSASRRGYI